MALAGVPANHGIAPANEITVQPGSIERLGNVDVSCPAGGPACVFSVAGDGMVAYRATGGRPTVVAATAVLTAIPANHGIAPANEITIQPGSTERLGNVDVSCPTGGPSCVFGVARDGMIAYRATGGTPTIAAATAVLTDIPTNHDIAPANEITIQSGNSERLGNVDVSCPAGGPACVFSVAGDGTVAYRATGGIPTVMVVTAVLTDIPADHGIAPTDEITIQPGSTEWLGNVDISCPASGPTCVVSVAGDGTVAYRRTGGVPTVVPVSLTWPLSPVVGSAPERDTLVDIIYNYAASSSSVNNFCCHGRERLDGRSGHTPPPDDLTDVWSYDWGYWADPDMHPEILKLQKRIKFEDKPPGGNVVDRMIFGILDHAVIWVADEGDLELYPDIGFGLPDIGAGVYYSNDPATFDLDVNRRPDVYIVGASWRGDALGIGKERRNFVTGQAVVAIDEVGRRQPEIPELWYVLDIDINFDNGYSISMTAKGLDGLFGGAVYSGPAICTEPGNCTTDASVVVGWEPWFGEPHTVSVVCLDRTPKKSPGTLRLSTILVHSVQNARHDASKNNQRQTLGERNMRRMIGLPLALIPVCGLALSGCGGGEDDYGLAFRAADVNGRSAIMATGGSPPDVSSAQAKSEQLAILDGANVRHRSTSVLIP